MSTLRRRMYSRMVTAADEALARIDKELDGGDDPILTLVAVRLILQRALDEAEEMYMSADEEEHTRMRLQEGE